MLRDFLCYHPKEKDESYVEDTNISTAGLGALVAAVVYCLEENETRGGHRRKEYVNVNERRVETATKQLLRILGNLSSIAFEKGLQ